MEATFHAEVNPRIKKLTDLFDLNMQDMRSIKTMVDIEFVKKERKLFATEGASGGAKWKPLSPAYAKRKKRKKPGRKILAYEGDLRRGLTGRRHADHVARYSLTKTRAVVTVGTKNPIASYHAPGYLHNPQLPVRDPIQLTRRQELDYTKIVRRYFVEVKMDRAVRALLSWGKAARRRAGR